MTKIISFLAVFVSSIILAQREISFEKGSFQELLDKAQKEKKLIFIDAYASWCGPCKIMERNVFSLESVANFYNANFVNAKFDMEKGEGKDLAIRYQVYSYPSFLFLNGKGEIVHKGLGYLPENQFIELGKEVLTIGTKGTAKDRFEKGETDPNFLINAIKTNAGSDPIFAKKVSERYFSLKKDKNFTKEEVSILAYFTKSTKDANYQVFAREKDAITKVISVEAYDEFDIYLKTSDILEKAIDEKTKTINDEYYLTEVSKLIGKEEAESNLNLLKMSYYFSQNNIPEVEKSAINYYKDGEGFNANELLKMAIFFEENIKNVDSLKKAVVWVEKSVMANETAENTLVLAKLYHKTGNTTAAKMFAEESAKIRKKSAMNTKETDELLKEISK